MSFLNAPAAIAAAFICVPLLLLLYVLKLRRLPMRVSSTLLWQSAFKDLEANVPFQRLRPSWLLLLQLLLLALLLLALAEPRLTDRTELSSRVVLLIDRSASMNTTDGDDEGATRFAQAKTLAMELVDDLPRRSSEVLVISFGATPRLETGSFESRMDVVQDRIEAIEPSDEAADLDRALELAAAFAARTDQGAGDAADVVVISDGGVALSDAAVAFRFIPVGPAPHEPVDNVGITEFSARRDPDEPGLVRILARLANAGPDAVETIVRLDSDGEVAAIRRVHVPAAGPDGPGESTLVLSLEAPGETLLVLRQQHEDTLAADDVAALVLPEPRRPRLVIVSETGQLDPFLADLLAALEYERVPSFSTVAFASMTDAVLRDRYEVIIFDGVEAGGWPALPSLTLGGAPPGTRVETVEPRGERFLSWDRQHPVLRYVSLDGVFYDSFGRWRPPADAAVLATGSSGPVIVDVEHDDVRHLFVGLTLRGSNWPLRPSSIIFLRNATDALSGFETRRSGQGVRPGEPTRATSVSGGLVTIPGFARCGVYPVDDVVPPMNRIAVSLRSLQESFIRTRDLGGMGVAGAGRTETSAPTELWPWLVIAVVILLAIEWSVYLWRASR